MALTSDRPSLITMPAEIQARILQFFFGDGSIDAHVQYPSDIYPPDPTISETTISVKKYISLSPFLVCSIMRNIARYALATTTWTLSLRPYALGRLDGLLPPYILRGVKEMEISIHAGARNRTRRRLSHKVYHGQAAKP
jgi:hypothetical protein